MTAYVLRRATREDSPALYDLHRAALGPYIEAIHGSWDDEVQSRFHREWFEPDRLRILEIAGDVMGVLDYTFHADHLELRRISLHPSCQNQGIGTALLAELLAQADARHMSATLEVFDINPARRLYERLGFVEVERDGRKIHMVRAAARSRPLGS